MGNNRRGCYIAAMQLEWFKVQEDVPEHDIVREIKVGKKRLTLVRDAGRLFAFQIKCPHAGGLLTGGWCEHGKLVCPIHRYSYDLGTGRGAAGQGDYINKYDVEERPDGIYVAMRIPLWKRFFRKD